MAAIEFYWVYFYGKINRLTQQEKRTNTQSSQIHGQSCKNPPSAGSDSDVLDNGMAKEMLGLHRSVVNCMRHGSKIKDPLMATKKKTKENYSVTTDPCKEKDTRICDISERKIAQAADSVDKMTHTLPSLDMKGMTNTTILEKLCIIQRERKCLVVLDDI